MLLAPLMELRDVWTSLQEEQTSAPQRPFNLYGTAGYPLQDW